MLWLEGLELVDPTNIDMKRLYPDKSYNHKPGRLSEIRIEDVAEPWRTRLLEMSERYGYEWSSE